MRRLACRAWCLLVAFLVVRGVCAAAPADGDAVAPFRILGPVHYVGTTELGAYLVTTPGGHVLVDGGYESTAPMVLGSIRALGFDPKDVRVLLTTQAHFDHVGSLAAFVNASGAKVMVMRGDAEIVERGGHRDPVFGDELTFPPVHVDRVLEDGDRVTVGGVALVAHRTPGHTPGCTTWTMDAVEGNRVYHVTMAGSVTVLPQMRLVRNPTYPGIADDFARSLEVLRALPTDVFLAAHAQMFGLEGKAARLRAGASPNPFVDPQGFRAYLDGAERAYRDRLSSER